MRCPICNHNSKNKEGLLIHIEDEHEDEIPTGWSANKYYYYVTHGNKTTGHCRECRIEVEFDESLGRPPVLCGAQKCKDSFSAKSKANAEKRTKGDKEGYESNKQRNALEGRKISGRYVWSDKTEKSYAGKQENKLLWALDNLAELPSYEVFSPCPFDIYYLDEESKYRMYIPDVYIISLNLVIEVKEDRKTNPNTHPKILKVDRVREQLKDKAILELNEFHYYKYQGDDDELMQVIQEIILFNSESAKRKKEKFLYMLNESAMLTTEEVEEQLTEDLYVGLLHPKGFPNIFTDIVFSYSHTFGQLYRYNLDENVVETSSITDSQYKGMGMQVTKYTGEDKGLPTKFFDTVQKYSIEDRVHIPDQFSFFARIINLIDPKTIDEIGFTSESFTRGNFQTVSMTENAVKLSTEFNQNLMESVIYMTELIDAVENDERELKPIAGEALDRLYSMGFKIPKGTVCLTDVETGNIILAKGNRAKEFGKELTLEDNIKMNILYNE